MPPAVPKSMLLWEFLCDLLKKGEQQQQQQLKQNDTNEVDEKEDDDDDDDDDELEKKINCEKAAKFGHVHRGFCKGSKRKAKVVIWENKEEGIFRIVDSKKVAELWGKHKANKKMSFEKFTRALRFCYFCFSQVFHITFSMVLGVVIYALMFFRFKNMFFIFSSI